MPDLARAELLDLEDAAVDMIAGEIEWALEALVDDDGLTYGDKKFTSEEDFMLFFQDLRDRGVLEMLHTVNDGLATRYERRYLRGLQKMIGGL